MARRKRNGADGEPHDTASSNVGNRAGLIQQAAEDIAEIRAERVRCNERMGEIRKTLKDAGISPKIILDAVRWKEQEDDAHGSVNTYFDGIREAFAALDVGGQGLLFPEVPDAPAPVVEGLTA